MTDGKLLTVIAVTWLCATAAVGLGDTPAAAGPASAPASQPADQTVLIRIGDRMTITQADFDRLIRFDPVSGHKGRNPLLMGMVTDDLLELYALEHPEMVPEEALNAKILEEVKSQGFDTVEAFRKVYESDWGPWSEFRRHVYLGMARAWFAARGAKLIADEDKLKEIFNARKWEFDSTSVRARQLFFFLPVFASQEERQKYRSKLETMREDILSGKRTWEQCAAESDSAIMSSDLGVFMRHLYQPESVAEAAFKLEVGQISDVVESPLGLYLIQVTEKIPPREVPWDSLKKSMKRWMEAEEYVTAMDEMRRKYPVVGVQEPREFKGPPASMPTPRAVPGSKSATTHPVPRKKAAFFGDKLPTTTRAATATRPATTRPATTRPAQRSATSVPAGQKSKAANVKPAKKKQAKPY
jgi:hypothetical protein